MIENKNNSEVLESKGDYQLQIGSSLEDGRRCYQLLNVVTGVVEVETLILLQGYKFLEEISSGIDMFKDNLKQETKESTTITNKVTSIH